MRQGECGYDERKRRDGCSISDLGSKAEVRGIHRFYFFGGIRYELGFALARQALEPHLYPRDVFQTLQIQHIKPNVCRSPSQQPPSPNTSL
jgi:hypothetical protein